MSNERKNTVELILLLYAASFIVLILHWAFLTKLFHDSLSWLENLSGFFEKIQDKLLAIRLIHLGLGVIIAFVSAKKFQSRKYSIPIFTGTIISVGMFLLGYIDNSIYDTYLYPLFFLLSTVLVVISTGRILSNSTEFGAQLTSIPGGKDSITSIILATNKGKLVIPRPIMGVYIEGAAGSGKSVLIETTLNQMCRKGYAGFLYDFEGDYNEGGAILSRNVFTSLANQVFSKNEPPVKFAFLNFTDLSRTVRTNPISPKYVKTDLEILEIANVIMKNLEKEWIQKTDFWANNAINYMQGSLLMLSRNYPQFCTVPHLIELMLSSHDSVLNFLASDPQIHKIMVPILTAHEQQAKEQLAGVISSAQLPITKLRSPEVYYVLNPAEQNNFNLDITNPSNPIFLCVGNSSRLTNALGPIIALIASICMQQMNQLGKRRSLFVVDELPTLFIPNLDNLPATARKKGVSTILAVQSFKQLESKYGRNIAEITRDNLSNQFIGKTNSTETAERVVKMFGEYKKTEISYSFSDTGQSQSQSQRKENFLQLKDIMQQQAGHFSGLIADGNPPFFHCRLNDFKLDKDEIPPFNPVSQEDIMDNFKRVQEDIASLIKPYAPANPDDIINEFSNFNG